MGKKEKKTKEMATHSSALAWNIPWTEEPGKAAVHGVAESDMTEWLHLLPFISINTENAVDSNNHSGQKLSFIKIEGNFNNMTKMIYKKLQTKTLQLTCLMVKYWILSLWGTNVILWEKVWLSQHTKLELLCIYTG